LILTVATFIILQYFLSAKQVKKTGDIKTKFAFSNFRIFMFLCFCVLICSCFYVLIQSLSAAPLISPWQAVPVYFFALYALLILIIIIIIYLNPISNTQYLIPTFYFLSFSIALVIYKIGYGFDPFIHQATVDLIDKAGSVSPKPFYYLGQYGLIVILHKITTISITHLDKLLVPLLAALTLPAALYQFIKKYFSNQRAGSLLVLAILILPFTFFIVTTPQNLAYLFLILTILYGLTCSGLPELTVVCVFALAALATHPIAGVPAIFFALTLTIYHKSSWQKIKKWLYVLIFILSSVAVPLSFVILSGAKDLWEPNNIINKSNGLLETLTTSSFTFNVPNQENFILNFIYLYAFNLKFIIIALVLAGIFLAWRHREHSKIFFLNLFLAASLLVSYFLTRQISFDFIIDYEQGDFAQRILFVAIIFCLPFILTALYWLIDKILAQKNSIKIPWLIFFVILITTSLYISYPRYDRYFNSHGYAVSQTDIEAVRWIEDNHQADYIVLANQQTSAAALREFGFKRYLTINDNSAFDIRHSQFYFYPIPTSSPLYQFYLDMVYDYPTKKTMQEAMELTGVSESYFVLNKYWWAFPKILEEAKLEADSWQELGNGEIYVFRYNK